MKKISLSKTIQNDILHSIAEKQLKPGDKLPTEFELMEKYSVSRITASNALSELAEQNIIVRYPRRGSFVTENVESVPPSLSAFESKEKKISIGFIIPSIRDLFALNLIHGLSSCFYDDPTFYLNISYCCDQASEEYIINDMMNK